MISNLHRVTLPSTSFYILIYDWRLDVKAENAYFCDRLVGIEFNSWSMKSDVFYFG